MDGVLALYGVVAVLWFIFAGFAFLEDVQDCTVRTKSEGRRRLLRLALAFPGCLAWPVAIAVLVARWYRGLEDR